MSHPDLIGPDPLHVFPMPGIRSLCFLKNVVTNPNIVVGDYTYYDDFAHHSHKWPARFHFFSGEKDCMVRIAQRR